MREIQWQTISSGLDTYFTVGSKSKKCVFPGRSPKLSQSGARDAGPGSGGGGHPKLQCHWVPYARIQLAVSPCPAGDPDR